MSDNLRTVQTRILKFKIHMENERLYLGTEILLFHYLFISLFFSYL